MAGLGRETPLPPTAASAASNAASSSCSLKLANRSCWSSYCQLDPLEIASSSNISIDGRGGEGGDEDEDGSLVLTAGDGIADVDANGVEVEPVERTTHSGVVGSVSASTRRIWYTKGEGEMLRLAPRALLIELSSGGIGTSSSLSGSAR